MGQTRKERVTLKPRAHLTHTECDRRNFRATACIRHCACAKQKVHARKESAKRTHHMLSATAVSLRIMASLSLRTSAEERAATQLKHSSTSRGTGFHARKGSGCCNDCNAKRNLDTSDKKTCARDRLSMQCERAFASRVHRPTVPQIERNNKKGE